MPQAPIVYAGTGEPVPPDQQAAALASGSAEFYRGVDVHMVAPDGSARIVPSDQAMAAYRDGYVPQSEATVAAEEQAAAERAKAEQKHKMLHPTDPLGRLVSAQMAMVTGSARGATFGLSDEALTSAVGLAGYALGEGYDEWKRGAAELYKAQRDDYPLLSAPSEIAGAVAGAFMPSGIAGKGVGLAGKALGLASAPARAGAALGGRAAAGLGLRGTTLASRIAAGAVRAGVGGAIEGAASGAGRELSEAVLEQRELTAEKLLAGAGWGALMGGTIGAGVGGAGTAAGEAASAALARLGGDDAIRRLLGKSAGKLQYHGLTGSPKKAAADAIRFGADPARAGQKAIEAGIPGHATPQTVQRLAEQADDATRRMSEIAQKMDDAGVMVDRSPIVNGLRDRAAKLNAADDSSVRKIAQSLQDDADMIEKTGNLSFGKVWEQRKVISGLDQTSGLAKEQVLAKRQLYSDVLEEALEKSDDQLAAQWRRASEDFSDFKHLQDHTEALVSSKQPQGWEPSLLGAVGTASSLASGNVMGAVVSPLAGAAMGAANRAVRERSAGWAAKALQALSKVDAQTDQAVRAIIQGGTKTTSKAATRSALQPAKAVTTTGEMAQNEAPEPSALASLAPRRTQPQLPETIQQIREVQRLAASPDALTERTAAALGGAAQASPELAVAMSERAHRAAQFLASKAPRGMSEDEATIQPSHARTTYSAPELAKFQRYAQAVSDPISVVQDLGRGVVNWEGLEALRTVYPAMYENLRDTVITQVAEHGARLPYNRRIMLSLAFDFPGDRSLMPQHIGTIQGSFAKKPTGANQSGPGRRSVKVEPPTTETPAQKALS